MDINNLSEAEKVSLAKADAAGVNVEARDNNGELIEAPVTPASAAPKVKPAGLPDKFWNATTGEADYAALAKSYTELEKARGKPATPPAAEAPAAAVTPEAKAAADAAALAAAKTAGATAADPAADPAAAAAAAEAAKAAAAVTPQATIDAASAEYAKDGKLSDATYETLAKTGINRGMVDMYIAGQQATRTAAENEAYELVGGREQYTQVASWAKANLTPAELSEYNANVASSRSIAKLAVQALHSRYVAANGTDGKLASGQNIPNNTTAGYTTQTELMAAINDPRYRKDAGYRAAVEAKIGRTADDII